jgi:hypothetical protein
MRSWLQQHKIALVSVLVLFLLAMIVAPALAYPFTISDIGAGNITTTTATITWATDEPGNSTVNYGATIPLGFTASDSAFVTNHVIDLGDLIPATLYYYEVSSTSEAGNITLVDNNGGNYYTFHTSPAISDVQATDIGIGSATITWTTDVPATSVVNYGETTALGLTASDSTLLSSHSIALSSLSQHTTYYYEVQSTDGEGNTVTDNNGGEYYTFATNDFMTAIAEPISSFIVTVLSGFSNLLSQWVDPGAAQPLTSDGEKVVDSLSQILMNFFKSIAQILVVIH